MLENVIPRGKCKALSRRKSREYLTKSVHRKLVDENLAVGWDVQKKGKVSTRLRKPKSRGILLEDRVWALLYRMEFHFFSGEGGAQLSVDPKNPKSPRNQIDVVELDDDLALAVECKTQETFGKRRQFQDELAKHSQIRERFSNAANSGDLKVGHKRQVVLLFFTSNIELTENDKDRAKTANVHLFGDTELEYYEKLVSHIGPAAKYQFFADMLPGKSVRGLEIRVPCVRTKMGPSNCYTFPISPEYLLKISYVSHRSKGKASDVNTYQRMLSKSRLNKIRRYINEDGMFPTNIVVNLDKKRLNFERIKQQHGKNEQLESGVLGWLDIRPAYKSAWIIDGQHRLFAYSGHPRAKHSHIPVLAFEGLPASKQAQLFIDINAKQKSVKQSLLQELFAELHWDADKPSVRVQAIISKAIQVLEFERESPLNGRIQSAEATKDTRRCITLTSLFRAIENNRFHIEREKADQVVISGALWAGDTHATLERTVYVLKGWFSEIIQHCSSWWELGSAEGGGLSMNDGVTACINVLRAVFYHLEKSGVKLVALDNEDLVEVVKPYANALGRHFGAMGTDDRKGFRDLRGVQGQTARTRRCQEAIRREIPDFDPPGLDDFIADQKRHTNVEAKLVTDDIETMLQTYVIEELKREFGPNESEWWVLGVPKKVRIETTSRFESDDGRRGSKEAYLDLLHYREIAIQNWDLLGSTVGLAESGNKQKKTNWMVTVNHKRNIVAHPSSVVSVSVEELAELERFRRELKERIQGLDADSPLSEVTDVV